MTPRIHAATIVQIIPRLDTGGAERAALEVAEAVVRAGGRAFVLSEGGRLAADIERAGGKVIGFPAGTKNPLRIVMNGVRLARFVRETGVDVLHARSRAPAWSALLAARITGCAFVTTYHGAYGQELPFKRRYNSVMARGDMVIANSAFTAGLIRQRHGTPESRIRIVNRGVDLEAFDPASVSADRVAALRKRWRANARDRIVLHAARLTGWKGQRVVIEAAARLAAEGRMKGVLFVLAGDAQGREAYAGELRARIASHGLAQQVRLAGHCSDMAAAYKTAHVTLVASTEPEAFGRASAEAQAMECPAIVTDQGASPETILHAARDGEDRASGWLVPPGDAEALADAIGMALALPAAARRAMGRRGRAHVKTMFSARQMKLRTLEVYDALLNTALARAWQDAGVRAKRGAAP